MSQLELTTKAFIDSLAGAKPLYTLSPEAARNVLAVAQKSVSVTLAPARGDDRILNVGPKGRTDIRIYRPENAKGTLSAVIYTHGGGWVFGDRETHLADVALAEPRNGIVEIAGPERAPFNEIVARYLKAVGDPRKVVSDPEARYWGGRVEEHSLVPLGEARLGRIGLDEWLRRSRPAA